MIGGHIAQKLDEYPKVVQIYTHSTTPYKQYAHAEDLVNDLVSKDVKFYVHSSFNCLPASKNFQYFMKTQFNIAQNFGASGIIVHIPNSPPMAEVADSFDIRIKSRDTIIYLEHIPGKYANPDTLKMLYEMVSQRNPNIKFGLCIDTCHIFVSGYDLGDEKVMSDYVEKIKSINCPIFVHLNDSIGELGSRLDRHNAIGTKIWTKNRFESLGILLSQGWDCVIEVNYEEKYKPSMEFVNYVLTNMRVNK